MDTTRRGFLGGLLAAVPTVATAVIMPGKLLGDEVEEMLERLAYEKAKPVSVQVPNSFFEKKVVTRGDGSLLFEVIDELQLIRHGNKDVHANRVRELLGLDPGVVFPDGVRFSYEMAVRQAVELDRFATNRVDYAKVIGDVNQKKLLERCFSHGWYDRFRSISSDSWEAREAGRARRVAELSVQKSGLI